MRPAPAATYACVLELRTPTPTLGDARAEEV
jgi:hypothetical protein